MSNRYYNPQGLVGIVLSNTERGWSTYIGNSNVASNLLFDPTIVEMVLEECDESIIDKYCRKSYPVSYSKPPGFLDLRVAFIPEGKQFIVNKDEKGEYAQFIENFTIYSS